MNPHVDGVSDARYLPSPTVQRENGEEVNVHTNRAWVALASAAAVTALLFGGVGVALATPTATASTPVSRANAVRAAKEYLRTQAFSFKSLVSQLRYEGFSRADARYGARHSGAKWMKQAVRAAKEYLRTMAFSRKSMIAQLRYDGFTLRQARHGATAVGL